MRSLIFASLGFVAGCTDVLAASSLNGSTVTVNILYPTSTTVSVSQNVMVDRANPEILCPGGNVGGGICGVFGLPAQLQIQDLSITLTQQGDGQMTPGPYNGIGFFGLNFGDGSIVTGFTLTTNMPGLTPGAVSFTRNSIQLNFAGLSFTNGYFIRLELVTGGSDQFSIKFTTFIPGNHIFGPAWHPQSWCDLNSYRTQNPAGRLVFGGDDRGFDAAATDFRARQLVTVVPDQALDPDGLVEGSDQNLTGITRSFGPDALANGRLDAADRDSVLGDCYLLHAQAPPERNGMAISVGRRGPKRVLVNLRSGLRGPDDPLFAFATSIDWEFVITIDTSGMQPTFELIGGFDGFPAAEIYINNQLIFKHDVSTGPYSFGDLLLLQPGIGDVHVNRSGTL